MKATVLKAGRSQNGFQRPELGPFQFRIALVSEFPSGQCIMPGLASLSPFTSAPLSSSPEGECLRGPGGFSQSSPL